MDRARKRLVSAIDGLRAQFTDADSQEDAASDFLPSTAAIKAAVREKIEPSNCRLSRIVRHGFPDDPRCMAYDPVQKLCAIGAGRGCVRLLGQAGVDHLLKHESDEPVMHVQFLVNEGGLVTALRDDTLHLWNYRQRIPEVVHSLRMSKERVSAIHLPFQSKWLMVGTDKGNVYFVCLATFQLSSFVIYWNKAVDMTCRTHPGAIKAMECCPTEPSKLLLVFEQGHVVLWNIVTKEAEKFSAATDLSPVTAVGWHNDGRQFMCGHQNGSLSIWNVKKPKELVHRSTPHSPSSPTTEGPPSAACKPIGQLSWNCNAESEQLIVFSGGMPADEGALPSLTVLRAKGSLTVLEMDHAIVSMLPLQNSPYASVPQHPPAIAVLLRNDLLVVDMQAQGYPCFEVPHPMDLHESPVTLLRYFSDCPVEMIAALTLVGRNQRRQGVRLSDKQWPISGGIGRECATGHQEIMLTGHEDGSIKFWQASSEQLQVMYKLKTGRHFEKSAAHFSAAHQHQNAGAGPQPATANAASAEEKPQIHPLSHAVADVHLCLDSRLLLVASCSGQTSLFRFAKTECCQEIAVIPLPQLCRSTVTLTSPSCPPSPTHQSKENREGDLQQATNQQQQNRLKQQQTRSSSQQQQQQQQQQRAELKRQGATAEPQPSRNSSHSTDATSMGSQLADLTPLKVRGGTLRRPAGYQPELVCQVPWVDGRSPEPITAISLNSAYGLLAVGTAVGLALVDTQTAALIYAWSNSELLGREPIPFWTSMPSQDTSITSPSGEHQFSTQTPPAPPPKSPGPLSRGNTTDSVGQENRLSSTSSTLGPRLHQRPQLIKAFTFNPQANGKDGGEEADTAQQQNCTTAPAPGEQQQTNSNNSNNCNGQLSVESRASSSDSLDKTGAKQQQRPTDEEFVCALQFINCCAKKGATKCDACLWLGTSAGASLAFQLQLPLNRITSSVVVAPSGSIVRLAGRVLALAFLDRNFRLLAGPTENFKNAGTQSQQQQQEQPPTPTAPANANSKVAPAPTAAAAEAPPGSAGPGTQNGGGGWEGHKPNKVLTKASQSPQLSTAGPDNPPASASEEEFSQMALFVAETEVRAVALPAYRQIFHRQFVAQSAEECPLVRATATHIGGQPALVALNAAGALIVLSLPSLRTLLHGPLLPHSVDIDDRLCDRYQMSEHGLGVHMVSPSEVQKFTVSAEIASQMADCLGELFVPCDMPEPPRQHSFFRGVISSLAAAAGAGSSAGYIGDQLAEMDALLSEKPASSIAGSQVRNVARPLPTQQNQQQQQLTGIEFGTARTVTAGQAAREAMQNLSERGERLNAVTDATEQLRNNAMNIQSRSAKLLEKYEKKKWYQL